MRLLLDMNLSPPWVPFFKEKGHEAVHWSSVGTPDAPDNDIVAYARDLRWFLLTNDLDFPQILAHTQDNGPSISLLRGEPLTPELRGETLLAALRACESDLDSGAVLSVDVAGSARARLLPLR